MLMNLALNRGDKASSLFESQRAGVAFIEQCETLRALPGDNFAQQRLLFGREMSLDFHAFQHTKRPAPITGSGRPAFVLSTQS